MSIFSIFFPSDQKKLLRVGSESTQVEARSASYLLRVRSKLGLGRVRAHLYCGLTRPNAARLRGRTSYGESTVANWHMANWLIWQINYGESAYGELVYGKTSYSRLFELKYLYSHFVVLVILSFYIFIK